MEWVKKRRDGGRAFYNRGPKTSFGAVHFFLETEKS